MKTTKHAEFTALQKSIIKEWQKTYVTHPSQMTIARKLKCSKETVGRAIRRFQSLKK